MVQRRVFHSSDPTLTFRNTKAVICRAICWVENRRRAMPNFDGPAYGRGRDTELEGNGPSLRF